jgi:hypothetical protein
MTTPLDGNVLAGMLLDLVGTQSGAGVGRCGACGITMPIAEARVYAAAPGTVARCPACDHVVMRLVRSPDTVWVDLSGLRYLQFPAPADT